MIPRHLEAVLTQTARQYPVVTLTGPRQSGKTTIVKNVFPTYAYVSLETPDDRLFAEQDPRGFLNRYDSDGAIFDEIQRCPKLFSYIQTRVDERDRPGQFILTGSQNFLLMESVTQSLAGRTALFHLLPFSRSELAHGPRPDLSAIGAEIPGRQSINATLFDVLLKGFYPRVHDKNLEPHMWYQNYFQTYVERDIRNLTNVGDLETFGRFVRLCAGRCGQLVNLNSLATDCGIAHTTANRWLSLLQTSFIIYLLRPHYQNFNKRLVKTPKIYFLDTGLLCYLLGIRTAADLEIHSARGAVFETYALAELLKGFYNRGEDPRVYFWRDSKQHEIDIILDQGQAHVAIEVKSGQTVAPGFFSGLEYWRKLVGDRDARTALVYGGDESHIRNNTPIYSWRDWL